MQTKYAFTSPLSKIPYKLFRSREKEGNITICLGEEPTINMSESVESFEEQSYIYVFKI